MATSTRFVYRQYNTIDNSGTGAGQQWLHALWQIFQYLFVDCELADTGRWTLLDSSPTKASWANVSNIVDNSWFAFECTNGRRHWQGKFQATNVTALDEAPATTYSLVVSLSNAGGWDFKGAANGGFAGSSLPAGTHLVLGSSDISGTDGLFIMHGDRDTLLISMAANGTSVFDCGCYLGRFEPVVGTIPYPECILAAGAGNNGFDRTVNGVFGSAPSSFALDATTPTPSAVSCQCYTSGWMDDAHQPDPFTSQYHYRPIEIAISDSPLGSLRGTYAAAALSAKTRMDHNRKLVLHSGITTSGVAIKHNGTLPP